MEWVLLVNMGGNWRQFEKGSWFQCAKARSNVKHLRCAIVRTSKHFDERIHDILSHIKNKGLEYSVDEIKDNRLILYKVYSDMLGSEICYTINTDRDIAIRSFMDEEFPSFVEFVNNRKSDEWERDRDF